MLGYGLGHYLFLVAHSFPRASLSENCSLLGTDNVRGYPSIFSRQIATTSVCMEDKCRIFFPKKLLTFPVYFFLLVPLEKFDNIRFLTFFESGSLGTTAIWLSSISAPTNVPISLTSSLGLSWLVIATPVISRQPLLRYCWVSSREQSIRYSLSSLVNNVHHICLFRFEEPVASFHFLSSLVTSSLTFCKDCSTVSYLFDRHC